MKKKLTLVERALIKKGKNAVWLASKLGVSHQAVYAWIQRKHIPSNENLFTMARVLNTKLEDLVIDFYN